MVPKARFDELLSDIEPSSTTKGQCAWAQRDIRDFLESHPDFGQKISYSFLSGSYARATAIRPKTTEGEVERPDIDVTVVTTFTTDDRPDGVLEAFVAALAGDYEVERKNKRSVRVQTSRAEIDIVPLIPHGDRFRIGDRSEEDWLPTNPPAHTTFAEEQNGASKFDGRFIPMVKLFKWWRRERLSTKRPKGIALEVLVAKFAPCNETHYGEMFAQLLENIASAYGDMADRGVKPFLADPAMGSNDILSKVSITNWKDFIQRVRIDASRAREAQDTEDMERATELWRGIFGSRFKSTARPAKGSSLAAVVAAPAAAGLTFPDRPVAPATPRKFA